MIIEQAEECCVNCKITFWITAEHQQELLRCHNTFYCPNGHPQSYRGETDKAKLERLEKILATEQFNTKRLTKSNIALRGVITKQKKELKDA